MEKFTAFTSALVKMGIDNIDTDQIIPARFLKTISKDGLGDSLFCDWRYAENGEPKPDFILNTEAAKKSQILLAGDNFGCGSSREHAPWALTQYGFRAVFSTSFADIFKSNSLKNGLLPIVVSRDLHTKLFALPDDARVAIDLAAQTVTLPDGTAAQFAVEPFSKHCLLEGVDEMGYIQGHEAQIAAFEASRLGSLNTLA